MVFIIGGACQGKLEYAKANFPEAEIVIGHHLVVREHLQAGRDVQQEVQSWLKTKKEDAAAPLVIISDEVGYGVVPVDSFERTFREENGRVNQFLAAEAEQVIRVIAGIGMRIK